MAGIVARGLRGFQGWRLRRICVMKRFPTLAVSALWLACSGPALAQGSAGTTAVAAPSSAPAPAASAAAPAAPAVKYPEAAATQRRVIEDDDVRIEETRVRGQVQRITVRSKLLRQDYEIQVGAGGRDPSQKRDGGGQRTWSLFSF